MTTATLRPRERDAEIVTTPGRSHPPRTENHQQSLRRPAGGAGTERNGGLAGRERTEVEADEPMAERNRDK